MKFYSLILATITLAKVYANECGKGYGSCGSGQCCSKYGWCGTSDSYCGSGCQVGYGDCNSTKTSSNTSSHSVSTNGRCGIKNGNTTCPDNKCCSKYGWCGTGSSYCDSGCQSEFGYCNGTSTSTKKTTTTKTSKTSTTKTSTKKTTTKSPNSTNHPTSTDGRCGPNNGNTSCPVGDCCSKYGWCGSSSNHCGSGCQSEFGMCNGGAITTTKTKTSTTKTASASHPTSTNGRCGSENGNTSCPDNECCSKYGWCGTSDTYCGSGCQSEFGQCEGSSSGGNSGSTSTPSSGIAVYSKCKNSKHWALTYDDGPYSFDESLLNYLKSEGLKATFFVNGDNVMDIYSEKGRRIIKRMINEGHEIGSHTWKHSDLAELSESGIKSEITKLENALIEIVGKKPALIRPPYGSGSYDSNVQKSLQNLGYTGIIMWNVDTLDWSNKGNVDYALSEFKEYAGQGIISLNHLFYEGITESKVVNLVKEEVKYMKSKGYKLVTVSECVGLKPYQ